MNDNVLDKLDLQAGEQIVWAETVDENLREDWIRESLRSDRLWAAPMFLFGLTIIWFVISMDRHADAELWVVFLGSAIILILGILFLFASYLCFKSFFSRHHYEKRKPFKAFILTNLRLVGFGLNDEVVYEIDATNLKKADIMKRWSFPNKWKSLCLILSPIGTGWFKFAELYFLTDFEKSKTEILSGIHSKDQPHE